MPQSRPRRRPSPQTADAVVSPAIALFRSIATASADSLLLADAPPHPDAELLDAAAEALHALRRAEELWASYHAIRILPEGPARVAMQYQANATIQEADRHTAKGRVLARRMGTLRANTPAGIYAKALVCRNSRTGAAVLACSLANDLVGNAALRAVLWPAGSDA